DRGRTAGIDDRASSQFERDAVPEYAVAAEVAAIEAARVVCAVTTAVTVAVADRAIERVRGQRTLADTQRAIVGDGPAANQERSTLFTPPFAGAIAGIGGAVVTATANAVVVAVCDSAGGQIAGDGRGGNGHYPGGVIIDTSSLYGQSTSEAV